MRKFVSKKLSVDRLYYYRVGKTKETTRISLSQKTSVFGFFEKRKNPRETNFPNWILFRVTFTTMYSSQRCDAVGVYVKLFFHFCMNILSHSHTTNLETHLHAAPVSVIEDINCGFRTLLEYISDASRYQRLKHAHS